LFHHYASASWMPWVLLGAEVALRRGTVAAALRLGALIALEALAGSADLTFMTGLLLAGRLALFVAEAGRPLAPPLREALKVAAIAAPFAAALAAIQWLPTLGYVGEGSRLGLNPAANLYWSVHPASLLDMVLPRLLSETTWNDAIRARLFESREPLFAS